MHQKNSNHVGSHHVEGFQDCSKYREYRYDKTIYTWDESPCKMWNIPIFRSVGPDEGDSQKDRSEKENARDNMRRLERE